jgi:hypothetical protein
MFMIALLASRAIARFIQDAPTRRTTFFGFSRAGGAFLYLWHHDVYRSTFKSAYCDPEEIGYFLFLDVGMTAWTPILF